MIRYDRTAMASYMALLAGADAGHWGLPPAIPRLRRAEAELRRLLAEARTELASLNVTSATLDQEFERATDEVRRIGSARIEPLEVSRRDPDAAPRGGRSLRDVHLTGPAGSDRIAADVDAGHLSLLPGSAGTNT